MGTGTRRGNSKEKTAERTGRELIKVAKKKGKKRRSSSKSPPSGETSRGRTTPSNENMSESMNQIPRTRSLQDLSKHGTPRDSKGSKRERSTGRAWSTPEGPAPPRGILKKDSKYSPRDQTYGQRTATPPRIGAHKSFFPQSKKDIKMIDKTTKRVGSRERLRPDFTTTDESESGLFNFDEENPKSRVVRFTGLGDTPQKQLSSAPVTSTLNRHSVERDEITKFSNRSTPDLSNSPRQGRAKKKKENNKLTKKTKTNTKTRSRSPPDKMRTRDTLTNSGKSKCEFTNCTYRGDTVSGFQEHWKKGKK